MKFSVCLPLSIMLLRISTSPKKQYAICDVAHDLLDLALQPMYKTPSIDEPQEMLPPHGLTTGIPYAPTKSDVCASDFDKHVLWFLGPATD